MVMDKDRELLGLTETFVEREFNYIQFSVLEKVSKNMLFEYIRQEEVNEEVLDRVYFDLDTEEKTDAITDFIEQNFFDFEFENFTVSRAFAAKVIDMSGGVDDVNDNIHSLLPGGQVSEDDFSDYIKEQHSDKIEDELNQSENYPMWSTCFEFRHEPSEDTIQAAINAGFGVIEGLDDFNTLLFVSGCGYSFFGAHWIPMYLNLPWNEDKRKEFADVKIDHL
jgi:hypothetical protein